MKKILLTFFVIFFLIFWGYFAFAKYFNSWKITLYKTITENIYPDSKKLNYSIIIFKSEKDISWFKIKSSCKNKNNFITQKDNLYFFKFTLLNNLCEDNTFYLTNWKKDFLKFNLNIIKKSDIFNNYSDYSDKWLKQVKKWLEEEINRFYKKNKINKQNIYSKRIYQELIYKKSILENILKRRKLKYENPVIWYKITTKLNQIPNAGRPYRSHYTDWVHHWWDIMAPEWTPVEALDDWIIIRVVSWFDFEDIASNIEEKWFISKTQKLRNLDILRWQQVWLKTTKWDVVFYSHLSKIYDNIKEWVFVKVWEKLWEIWKSWVPDRDYKDIHLHFAIMKNPHFENKIWNYTYQDIMAWNWYLKWLNPDEVLKKQKNIFIEEAF